MRKERLDRLLVQRKLVRSREEGRRLIMAGQVRVDGQVVDRPATRVPTSAEVTLVQRPRYVSRGGIKLEAALQQFRLDVTGMVCADVGASTGGFTDCLLQHGAARVYAIDVGYGQLAWKLRRDPRVVVMERVNARYLESLPEPVDLVTVDVSFISLRLILPQVRRWLKPNGHLIPLIKPQFEAGPRHVGKGGIVKDPAVHRRVLRELLTWAQATGWETVGLMVSPITGATGNVEFLAHLKPARNGGGSSRPAVETWIEAVTGSRSDAEAAD
ncbi:MAG: TlyA family RNA methyltransferase [Chloroflexi bacterium]|nr:MAG: TlyA family RNA methyltransferase [Chloroflexota bacterium]